MQELRESPVEALMKRFNNDQEEVILELYDMINNSDDLREKKYLRSEYNKVVDQIHDERKRTMYRHM